MSVFSNPQSGAADGAAAYIDAILDTLGDREPTRVLRETVPEVERLTANQPDAVMRHPENVGKWSAVEIVQHLADSELVWAYRLRVVAAEDRPTLSGYDQDAWATQLHYRDVVPSDALEQFRLLRRLNLQLLDSLPPRDLERVGLHNERGEESLALMVRLYAGHDLVHLRQMRRVLAAAGASRD